MINFINADSFMLAAKGWSGFREGFDNMFKNGLGKDGAQGIGWAVLTIGIVFAVVSFAMHHFNPQSRMPSWGVCLTIAIAGALIITGIGKPAKWLISVKNWIYSLVGV